VARILHRILFYTAGASSVDIATMEKPTTDVGKRDSDSGQEVTSEEGKRLQVQGLTVYDLPPDPDANLSAEERAKIVSPKFPPPKLPRLSHMGYLGCQAKQRHTGS
jgi:hypothetical protein